MAFFKFEPVEFPAEAEALRAEVRLFLEKHLPARPANKLGRTWSGSDIEFSKKMGSAGYLGMTWPKKYGGHERTSLERYVVLEEMLAADAPVAAHWIAERQSGNLILRYGTDQQKQDIVPKIARGELYFCIGMSEPDSGSDLASVRSRAEPVEGGYRLNGRKIWTSGAHICQYMIALVRTSGVATDRHKGLSQVLIDMEAPGVSVSPLVDLAGDSHFNEVSFEDVFLPDSAIIGEEGNGWAQVTAELAFERSGPERFLSSHRLIETFISRVGNNSTPEQQKAIGRLVAHLMTLRRMSVSVAGMLQAGEDPVQEASVVKDLGTAFEQDLPHIIQNLLELEPFVGGEDSFEELLAYLVQISPSFSLRGGTREILRGIIARGLGLR